MRFLKKLDREDLNFNRENTKKIKLTLIEMRENIQRKPLTKKISSQVLQKSSSSFTMDDNIPIDFANQVAEVVAEKLKGQNLTDLHTLISRNQSKKFIKKIFCNNFKTYETNQIF